jgi:hypothetical protein
MNKKILIIALIILLPSLIFFSCLSGDKYRTYRLDGVPLNHKTKLIFFFWISFTDDDGSQEIKVINKTNNVREFQIFDFSIGSSIIKNNNGKLIRGGSYTLWMNFDINDVKKIIVNKLIFKSKSKVIDIREIVGVSYMEKSSHSDNNSFKSFPEEKLINFINLGMIDLNNLNNESRVIDRIQFVYNNVDVVFQKDRFFTIECDITLDSEAEGIEPENYSFTAKFNRIKYTGERMSLLQNIPVLWYMLLFSISK